MARRIHMNQPKPVSDRIRSNIIITDDGCWVWRLAKEKGGYGIIRVDGKTVLSHRAAYLAFVGPIPAGFEIDHLCQNRACCNPHHLEAVTPRENWWRSTAITRKNIEKTHCPSGHPYSGDNLRVYRGNARYCRACQVAHRARYAEIARTANV